MKRVRRQTFPGGARQDEVWAGYRMRWLVYQHEVVTAPLGWVKDAWDSSAALHGRRAPWPVGGVFAPVGWAASSGRRAPLLVYDPFEVDVPEELLLAVQRLRPDDPEAVAKFLSRYGRLGVGLPGTPTFPFDGVAHAGTMLAAVQRRIEALHALRGGRPQPKGPASWAAFAGMLNGFLPSVRLVTRPVRDGLGPAFRVQTLFDVICLELWHWAPEGHRLRRCPECPALFIPGRRNQRYCTHQCANRPTVRRWKRRKKQKRRRAS